jgi:hypothetical protein
MDKVEVLIQSEKFREALELLRTLDNPKIYKDFKIVMFFNNVAREYDEYGSLKFLDGSFKDGYFKGISKEDISYTFEINSDNINSIIILVNKIEKIIKNEKNIIIKYNDLPDYIDEYYDSHQYETFGDTFHIKDSKIDKKLYFVDNIFGSKKWDSDYSRQQYDYDDKMILADSTEHKFGIISTPSSVSWYFE